MVAAVVMAQRWVQAPRDGTEFLLVWSGWGLSAAVVLWVALRRVRVVPIPKEYLVALQIGVLGLCVPAYLYVWRTPWESFDWAGNFLNKRWLLALFWLAAGTCLVLPHLVSQAFSLRTADKPSET